MLKFLCLSETPSEQKLIFLERSLLACCSHLLEPSHCSIIPSHRCTSEAVRGRLHRAYQASQFFPGNCFYCVFLQLPFSLLSAPFDFLSFLPQDLQKININYQLLICGSLHAWKSPFLQRWSISLHAGVIDNCHLRKLVTIITWVNDSKVESLLITFCSRGSKSPVFMDLDNDESGVGVKCKQSNSKRSQLCSFGRLKLLNPTPETTMFPEN